MSKGRYNNGCICGKYDAKIKYQERIKVGKIHINSVQGEPELSRNKNGCVRNRSK